MILILNHLPLRQVYAGEKESIIVKAPLSYSRSRVIGLRLRVRVKV